MRVETTVQNNCTVQAQPLAFGIVTLANVFPLDMTARIVVTCGANTPYTVALDDGQHFTTRRRVHNAGANAYLDYEIYSDSARIGRWGNSSGQIVSGNTGTSGQSTLTAYGRLPFALLVFTGPYTDEITVTVNF